MSKMRIAGRQRLSGAVKVQGAKNSALPILAAAVLTKGESVIYNCPALSDVEASLQILRWLGCRAERSGNTVLVSCDGIDRFDIPDALMRKTRSSIVFLGAVLAARGRAKLSFPGGCEIGLRPIDIHLRALKKLGAVIKERHGFLDCRAPHGLVGAEIALPFPSVGATEDIMLAACTASGTTTVINAAREPEISDLADYLNNCGAKIYGAGEGVIVIDGVDVFSSHENELRVSAPQRLQAMKIVRTMPYPGFPTDAQAPLLAASTVADGTTVFIENIFENRYRHTAELVRMGAEIKTEGKFAVVEGVSRLYGASVEAGDLRGAAALIAAGLSAEGTTEVGGVRYLERGYEDFELVLTSLGADIKKL